MRKAHRALAGALAMALGSFGGSVFADTHSFQINGGASFDVTSGSPVPFTINGVPAINNIFGYTLSANWAENGGGPWSSDLLAGVTPSGLSASGGRNVGGADDSSPFVFPGSPFGFFSSFNGQVSNAAYVWHGGANATAGDWTVEFDTSFGGSAVTLSNAALTVYSNPSHTFIDTNATGNTYDRPEQDGSSLSGQVVDYDAETFVASATGRHLFAADYDYDGFMALYEGSFDPLNGLANLIAAADDEWFSGTAANTFSADLVEGQTYVLVFSAFGAGDTGNFTGYILGPAAAVPEPATFGLAALGVAGAWCGVKRNRARRRAKKVKGAARTA